MSLCLSLSTSDGSVSSVGSSEQQQQQQGFVVPLSSIEHMTVSLNLNKTTTGRSHLPPVDGVAFREPHPPSNQ